MNKILTFMLLLAASAAGYAQKPRPEKLDRGLVVARGNADGSYFASWRLLATDSPDISFTLLRDGKPVKENITGATSTAVEGKPTSRWQIVSLRDGTAIDTTKAVLPWQQPYLRYHLQKPSAGKDYDYTPNDCSTGDVDGDGQYEIIVKWEPTNAHDNSQDGMTGPVFLDCYKLDMTVPANDPKRLWRIDLGPNIRAGAHYTQFLVYDFDGDGRSELMCKTAPGSRDGRGNYVNQASDSKDIRLADNGRDWRNSRGRVNGGQEYLTVFDGEDGHAINTIYYMPNRNTGYGGDAPGTFQWEPKSRSGDNGDNGNRGERYLAAVAYLNGFDKAPCAIFTRGYYTQAFAWAVTFDGKRLHTNWFHESRDKEQYSVTDSLGRKDTYNAPAPTSGSGSGTLFANGNHNLSIADVDGDGRDEMLWGAAALDDNGKILYSTGYGHGDAMHVADLIPENAGLEVFDVHEKKKEYAWDIHDAATGRIILKAGPEGIDNGRGLAAQIDSTTDAYYFWSAGDPDIRSAADGKVVSGARLPINFRIYWDGDAQDELLDGVNIRKWNAGGTKLLGIFGDVDNERKRTLTARNGATGSPMAKGLRSFQRPSLSFNGYGNPASNNWTKSTPCLQADLFGDWREEVVYRDRDDNSTIYIYTTEIPTAYRYPTLMHDHVYRMGIAWQNVAYNQPPHLGVNLPKEIKSSRAANY